MLQKLNEGIKGWVATVIVVAISVSFVIFGISYYLNSRSGASAVIAKVGTTTVTNQELQSAFRREQFARERTQGAMSKQERQYLKKMVLDALIQQAVRMEALKKLGLRAPKSVIEEAIQGLPAFQRGGRYDPEILQQKLAQSSVTLDQLMQQVGSQLITQQLHIGIAASTFVLPQSVQAMDQWARQTRNFRYVMIPAKAFLAGVKVNQQELQAYYQAHQKDYSLPDRVQISYLKLSPAAIAKGVAVSSAQIKQYYEANKSQFRLPAIYRYADVVVLKANTPQEQAKRQQEIDAVNAVLKSGKSLQAVANQFGGSVQSSAANKLNPGVLSLLQTMQPGQLLPEQHVAAGKLWLQLISVKPGAIKPLSAVQKQIKAMLVNRQVAAKMAPMTEKLSDMTYTQSNSLRPAAKALGLTVQQSGLVAKTGNKKGLFANKKLMNAAFSDEVLKQGNNSMPISLADGSVVVLRIKTFKQAQVRPLKAVKTQVLQHVREQASQLQAALFATKLQQRLEAKQSVVRLLASHQLSWKQLTDVSRMNKTVPATVSKAVFALQQAPAVTTIADTGVTTLIQLQAIQLPQSPVSDKQKMVFAQTVRSYYANMDMAAVLTTVQQSIVVKRYPKRVS
jgi:peptidyl-prolyl cis-trans isomerase D